MALVLALAACGKAPTAKVDGWSRYCSASEYFAVRYPPAWTIIASGTGTARLNILSGPRMADTAGVFIGPGQAEILVRTVNDYNRPPLLDYTGTMPAGRTLIEVADLGRTDGCEQLARAVSRGEEVPGRQSVRTTLVCDKGSRRFLFEEHHWEGDPRQADHQAVARRMSDTLGLNEACDP